MSQLSLFEGMSLVELTTEDELEASFRLRFEIFCKETGFLPAERFPTGLEHDQYDDSSIHVGCYFQKTPTEKVLAGSVRIVDTPSGQTPMLDHCIIDDEYRHLFDGRKDVAELSRMCVRSSFRRKSATASETNEGDERSCEQVVFLSLMKGAYHVCKRKKIGNWLIATEDPIHRNLLRNEICLEPIGPEVDCFGPVRPYLINLRKMEERLFSNYKEYWSYLNEGLEEHLQYKPRVQRDPALEAN
ncbi:PEP-CTERM/exosortase system-associated acyltransferase [Pseudovibrio denitrificans]|uniref:PEP-CTERM/exosortase system-associated acyltransferase n=1 Tax=Pseudovibrio denitrificans TaxID=258256 RepID=UPI0039BFF26A